MPNCTLTDVRIWEPSRCVRKYCMSPNTRPNFLSLWGSYRKKTSEIIKDGTKILENFKGLKKVK